MPIIINSCDELNQYILKINPNILAISGMTCSGKTYLAKQVSGKLKKLGKDNIVLSLDRYFKDISDTSLPQYEDSCFKSKICFDHPDSFHQEEYVTDINKLLAGANIRLPIYDIESNHRISVSKRCQLQNKLLITEGLYAVLYLHYSQHNIMTVYLDTNPHLCSIRRITRDNKKLKIPLSILKSYFDLRLLPVSQSFIFSQSFMSDYIMKGE